MRSSFLKQKAQYQQTVTLKTFQPRRTICDRNNIPLAIDTLAYDVFVHPSYFNVPLNIVADQLSPILNKEKKYLEKIFKQSPTGICLIHQFPENKAKQIVNLNIDGIDLIQHPKRNYPYKELVAGIIGYVDTSSQGQAGIELSCQESLQLNSPNISYGIDGKGNLISHQIPKELFIQDNLCLQLTLDLRLQKQAYKALQYGMKKCNAKRGTAIVLNSNTGEILAFVIIPSYDPNYYYKFSLDHFKTWPITDVYEPGSTFKPLNVAIALETKSIFSDSFFHDEGCIRVGENIITNNNYSYYQEYFCRKSSTFKTNQILSSSRNVGMIHILNRIAPEIYYSWLQKLGIGLGSNIETDFALCSESYLKDKNEFFFSEIEPATSSFGQGLSMTPIKLIQLYASIANGGKLVRPYLVTGLIDLEKKFKIPISSLKKLKNNSIQKNVNFFPSFFNQKKQIFSFQTTKILLNMLEDVIWNGTGSSCFIDGYRIGGKTGTSQKHNELGGYSPNKILTSFAAIFPVDSPKYVILTVIDEPNFPLSFGSNTAAPIVKSIIESLISITNILPSFPNLKINIYESIEGNRK